MADNVMQLNINLTTIDTKSTEQEQLDNATAPAKSGEGTPKDDKAMLKKAVLTTMAYHQIQRIATQVITTKLSQIGSVYGDQATQNQINNMISTAGTVSNIAQATIAGAVFGPIGAAIALVGAVVVEGYSASERNASYNRWVTEDRFRSERSSEALGLTAIDRNRR